MRQRPLALSGFILLVLALFWLSAPSFERLREERAAAASIRATLVAGEVARQLGNALQLGIPLSRLAGVSELFSQTCKRNPGVISVAFFDDRGQLLQRFPDEPASASAPAATAKVNDGKEVRGRIEVRFAPVTGGDLLLEIAALILSTAALGGTLAMLLLQHATASGPKVRDRATTLLCAEINAGRFDAAISQLPLRDFDKRPQWLARRLRDLREKHARLTRLVDSLIGTEPSATGRERLHALRRDCEDGITFGGGKPRVISPFSPEESPKWMMLMLSMPVSAMRYPLAAGDGAGWILAVSWLALAAGFLVARRTAGPGRGWPQPSVVAFCMIVSVALIPLFPIARIVLAGSVCGYAIASLDHGDDCEGDLRYALVGDLVGLLAGALLARIAPDAPAVFGASVALLGIAGARHQTLPQSLPRALVATPPISVPSIALTGLAGVGIGTTLAAMVWMMADPGFLPFLPLALAVPAVGWFGTTRTPRLPLRGTGYWLGLASGAGVSSAAISSAVSSPWPCLAAGIAGILAAAWLSHCRNKRVTDHAAPDAR